jgi:hypothetical protein
MNLLWIKFSDRMPDRDGIILCYIEDYECVLPVFYKKGLKHVLYKALNSHEDLEVKIGKDALYWMDLPLAPYSIDNNG